MKRWPLRNAWFWETAPFFRILLPFAAGIVLYDAWPAIPVKILASVSVAAFIIVAILLLRRTVLNLVTSVLINIVFFLFGLLLSYSCDIRNDPRWFGKKKGNDITYLTKITDAPLEKEKTWKLTVSIAATINNGVPSPAAGKAFLYLYKDDAPMLFGKGDSLLIPGNWEPIANSGNPFSFDYAAFCRRNNILLQQFASPAHVRLYATADPAHASLADRCHDHCLSRLDTFVPNPRAQGLLTVMLLGDEVNLDEDLRQSYSETGIIHIIAISGGHMSVFFFIISFLLSWIKNRKYRWISYVIALPVLWFYVFMAGAPPSAIRAGLMFSILAVGIVLQKSNNRLNQLFVTAFVLLCVQPTWLFSAGFQLSFAAVLSLILFYRPVWRWAAPPNKILAFLWGAVAGSIAAEVLVAPLVIYYFHTFPLLFVVTNVLAYLFMGLVLILGMLIVALSFLPAMAIFISVIATCLVTTFDDLVSFLQQLNPASFHFLALSNAALIVLYVAISCIAFFLLHRYKPSLFTGMAAGCVLLSMLCSDTWVSARQQRIVVYNSKPDHIEMIAGNSYSVLSADTPCKKTVYATQPAHIGWRAWHEVAAAPSKVAVVNGKSLLVLDHPFSGNGSFHADYLVVNAAAHPSIPVLQKVFTPHLIVLGSDLPKRQKEKLIRDCAAAHITVHDLATEGALVIE